MLLCIGTGWPLPPRLPLGRSDSARLPAGLLVAPAGVAAQPVAPLGWARGRESLGKPPRPYRPGHRLQLAWSLPSEARQPQAESQQARGGEVGVRGRSTWLPEKDCRCGPREQGQATGASPLGSGGRSSLLEGTDPTCWLAHAPGLLEELGKSWRNTSAQWGSRPPGSAGRGRRSVSFWRTWPLSEQQGRRRDGGGEPGSHSPVLCPQGPGASTLMISRRPWPGLLHRP